MSKSLVIVESPAKARTLGRFLGDDYVISASMGHVRDLPAKTLGVKISDNFKPTYKITPRQKKTIDALKRQATKVDAIYLAPDPDREGEAIAWHLKEILKSKLKSGEFHRITFHEITKNAILSAFDKPGKIDMDLVDAQQARRILDRIVGYKISPELWKNIGKGLSAGRVQTVALRLICEREREIMAFIPEEYWVFGGIFQKAVGDKKEFEAKLTKINANKPDIKNAEEAKKITDELENIPYIIDNITEKTKLRKPGPPFITSTLQRTASSYLRMSTSQTMRIAQQLYEGMSIGAKGTTGLITYMRTDSVQVSKEAQSQAKTFIKDTFGDSYIPAKPNYFKSKKSAQQAHEAIRPTDVSNTPEKMERYLDGSQLAIYKLIWKRFVASQMAPAKLAHKTVEIIPKPSLSNKYIFTTKTVEVIFAGFMKVTGNSTQEKEKIDLPDLKEKEDCNLIELQKDQKFTQPPSRFSEGTLVGELEKNGVGRPSTYSSIIATLYKRYIKKEKGSLVPEQIAFSVIDFLLSSLGGLFNVEFTAEMENILDDVESGKISWEDMLKNFYGDFEKWLLKMKHKDVPKDDKVKMLFSAFESKIDWAEPIKIRNRVMDDQKFFNSLKTQFEDGKDLTNRQWQALERIAAKYYKQLKNIDEIVEKTEISDDIKKYQEQIKKREIQQEKAEKGEMNPDVRKMLDALQNVNWQEPVTQGKRVYDDKKFYGSLKEQAESGRTLTTPQIKVLKKFISKYAEQIDDFEHLKETLNISVPEQMSDDELKKIKTLIEFGETIKEWKKPPKSKKRRRTTDKKFFESIQKQYKSGRNLSAKQVKALEKLLGKYK